MEPFRNTTDKSHFSSHTRLFGWLLLYVLATSKGISVRASGCDSAHSWWLYNAAPLEDQSTSTMVWYPTQSHYPDTEPTSPCPILIMWGTRLGNDKYHFCISLVWVDKQLNSRRFAGQTCALPIRLPCLMYMTNLYIYIYVRYTLYGLSKA